MTDKQRLEALRAVARLAGAVTLEVPDKPAKYASCAKVPWHLIIKLRAALGEAGFDMEQARANYNRLGEREAERKQMQDAHLARVRRDIAARNP